jgi:hypothetical protein
MATTHGSGLSVMPGGNMLLGSRFLETDPTGMTVRFTTPGPGFTPGTRVTEPRQSRRTAAVISIMSTRGRGRIRGSSAQP